jgi:hypothetical protein
MHFACSLLHIVLSYHLTPEFTFFITKEADVVAMIYLGLHSGGTWLESQLRDNECSWFFSASSGYDCFLPNPIKFTTH